MSRVNVLRTELLAVKDGLRRCRRETLIRQSLKNTESAPWPIRRAKAFQHILENTEPVILDGELIVGSILDLFPLRDDVPSAKDICDEAKSHLFRTKRSGKPLSPSRTLMEHDYDYLGARVAYEDLRAISQDLADLHGAELGLTYGEIFGELQRYFSEDPQVWNLLQQFFHARDDPDGRLWNFTNHAAVDYEKVLSRGYGGLLKEVRDRSSRADRSKKIFYQAAAISLDAVIHFISRYADRAAGLAAQESNLERKAELEHITVLVRRISREPAQGFHQALQLFWLTHLALAMAGGIALAAGRFDQYMHPFYRRDVEEKRITPEEALELLTCLWLKFNEPKLGAVQNLTVGGLSAEGNDTTNELSFLCLEAARLAKCPYPNLSVRIHKRTPEAFFKEVSNTIRLGMGFPSVFNDEILIPALCNVGFAMEDARDYCVMGCQEIMIPKKQPSWEVSFGFNLPNCLERVLIPEGRGNRFPNFTSLLLAYKAQVAEQIHRVVVHANRKYRTLFTIGSEPFGSALLDDCLELGRDMYQRGTRYPAAIGMWCLGLATAADSLAAIRKLVFEDRAMSLDELAGALQANFENHEALRLFLLNKAPKFGNDDDGVDLLAKEIAESFCREVLKHRGPHEEFYLPLLASYTGHVGAGEETGATPDGRRSGEPISDAASPAQGRDLKGPTAVLRSATKIDYTLAPGGVALNIKFSAGTLKGEKGVANLSALLKAYFESGGQEIQVNVVDRAPLIDAKAHPEQYRNLIVRVAGFNEYFVKLDANLQDEIIARTEH